MKDFLSTDFTFAVVLKGDVDTIKEIKKYLDEFTDIQLVYQKMSLDKLYISQICPSGSEGHDDTE